MNMVSPSNNSFIPKRGTKKNRNQSSTRQVYIFTSISYIILFATLITATGSYFYKEHVMGNLEDEITALTTKTNSFDEAGMQKVMELNRRLTQASDLLESSISVVSLFEALELATAEKVLIQSLSIERTEDQSLQVEMNLETDSFDATMFQRASYDRNIITKPIVITNVQASDIDVDVVTTQFGETQQRLPTVSFTASFTVDLLSIPYVPIFGILTTEASEVVPEESSTEATSTILQADDTVSVPNNQSL